MQLVDLVPTSTNSAVFPSVAADGEPRRVIAFFGHDSTEHTIVKRVTAFQSNQSRVLGFMFKRVRKKPATPIAWENIELGETVDRNYLRRIPKLVQGIATVLRHRHRLHGCKLFYARNIDMLLVALVTRVLARSKAPVVYEVLDVQRIFVGSRPINAAARWAERRLLSHCCLLVVSSPEFMTHYFIPQQRYTGPWHLLENKVSAASAPCARSGPRPAGPPWVIGWFGTLRCRRSLHMLCKIADTLCDAVSIQLRGVPSHEDLSVDEIRAAATQRRNLHYGGAYTSPDDLAAIYANVHFAWCVDYLDAGSNSDWLLPNRIYEGGLMGALALARRDTAVGHYVEGKGLGWTFAEPFAERVIEFLQELQPAAYERARMHVGSLRRSLFVDETDTRDLLLELDALAERRSRGNPSGQLLP